jgi:hypothetical protein
LGSGVLKDDGELESELKSLSESIGAAQKELDLLNIKIKDTELAVEEAGRIYQAAANRNEPSESKECDDWLHKLKLIKSDLFSLA